MQVLGSQAILIGPLDLTSPHDVAEGGRMKYDSNSKLWQRVCSPQTQLPLGGAMSSQVRMFQMYLLGLRVPGPTISRVIREGESLSSKGTARHLYLVAHTWAGVAPHRS